MPEREAPFATAARRRSPTRRRWRARSPSSTAVAVRRRFLQKAQNAAANGAAGVIIANIATANLPTIAPGMAGVGPVTPLIGVLSLNLADGNAFKAPARGRGNRQRADVASVRAQPRRRRSTTRSSPTSGATTSATAWSATRPASTNIQGRGMGEGWGDFHAMLLSVKPEDVTAPGNETWNGVYGMAGYSTIAFTPGNNDLLLRHPPLAVLDRLHQESADLPAHRQRRAAARSVRRTLSGPMARPTPRSTTPARCGRPCCGSATPRCSATRSARRLD